MRFKKFCKKIISTFFIAPYDDIILTVREKKLTYLSQEKLVAVYDAVKSTNHLDGILIEAGCALGGSGIVIAKAKADNKDLYIYDIFGQIPPPSEKDGEDVHARYATIAGGKSTGIGGELYYGYRENLLDQVKENFKQCGIELSDKIHFVKGLYQDTLKISSPVSFAHIDCDWYESVMICLEQIIPNLMVGGLVIIDDYVAWSGCRRAVDEYLSRIENNGKFKISIDRKLLLQRLS